MQWRMVVPAWLRSRSIPESWNHPYFLSSGDFLSIFNFDSSVTCDFQVQYGVVWALLTKITATLAHFLWGNDFKLDVFNSLILTGYSLFKNSIKYITFNELSRNGLSKQENWFETIKKLKFRFLSHKCPHLGLKTKATVNFHNLFTSFNDTEFVNNILHVFLMKLAFF